jgi:hypothetical protein
MCSTSSSSFRQSASAKMHILMAQFLLLGLILLVANCNGVFPLEFGMDEQWPEDTAGFVMVEHPRVRKLIQPPPLKRAMRSATMDLRQWRPVVPRGWARRNAILLGGNLFI